MWRGGEEEERKSNHQTRAELSRPDCMRLRTKDLTIVHCVTVFHAFYISFHACFMHYKCTSYILLIHAILFSEFLEKLKLLLHTLHNGV